MAGLQWHLPVPRVLSGEWTEAKGGQWGGCRGVRRKTVVTREGGCGGGRRVSEGTNEGVLSGDPSREICRGPGKA